MTINKLESFVGGFVLGVAVSIAAALTSVAPSRVYLKDINNDGREDVVITHYLADPVVYLQMPDKSFKHSYQVKSEEQESVDEKYQKCRAEFDSKQRAIAEKYILMYERAKSLDSKVNGGRQ